MPRRKRLLITGERVSSPANGFNPTWQRHVAAYSLCAPLLPPGRVLDLGCGVGHSFRLLAPRETVGVDVDPNVLVGQERETVAADMRELPFPDGSFSSLLSVQSIEHVPNPQRAMEEGKRVLEPGGVAIFVTPNRLTFGRPDEIIDPYHYVEFSSEELHAACAEVFDTVDVQGLFGSDRYLELIAEEKATLERALSCDPLGLRRLLPRGLRQRVYDGALRARRRKTDPRTEAIEVSDFDLRSGPLDDALDLIAICRSQG